MAARYFLQPFQRRPGGLAAAELIVSDDEDRLFRIGRSLQHRMAGMAFYKIECSDEGDEWTQVEMLCAVGDVPPPGDAA